jgi:hypothetical protein
VVNDPIVLLIQIAIVIIIAGGAVLLLLRSNSRVAHERDGILRGYPSGLYPNQEVARSESLAALAATQARLLSVYERLPTHTDLSDWLRDFLHELREVMDNAYRVATITQAYGDLPQLQRLVDDVQRIEAEVADQIAQQLLARDEHLRQSLDHQLLALRQCAHELPHTSVTRALDG